MSQLKGFIYLIKRDGEDGKRGNIKSAIQLLDRAGVNEVIDALVNEQDYYIGALEEYEEYSNAVAGDIDGDGDYDKEDQRIANSLKE